MGAVVGEGDAVRFTYELTVGPAPLGSCAMNVARIAGFPADLLKRAKDVADKSALSGALALYGTQSHAADICSVLKPKIIYGRVLSAVIPNDHCI